MKVLIFCGGRSPEHEISIKSAYNIVSNLDPHFYEPLIVGMSRSGKIYLLTFDELQILHNTMGSVLDDFYPQVLTHKKGISVSNVFYSIDVCFPIIHGVGGEDGVLQGLLEYMEIPYVGCDVKASALCMDKDITKRVLQSYGIPVIPFVTKHFTENVSYKEASEVLGEFLFVKASCQGSSLGTYKVVNENDFNRAVKAAFEYGPKIIIEKALKAREIECAVMGNTEIKAASILGEIVPKNGFYDYCAKYIDIDGAKLIINPDLPVFIQDRVRFLALEAFKVLGCTGLARIDFFVDGEDVYLNELNTLPGFTNISMYPKLFIESGMPYTNILKELILLGIEQHNFKQSYKVIWDQQ